MTYTVKKCQYLLFFCLFCASILSLFKQVEAHPHSWIDLKTEIVGNETHILGFKMYWTFDAMTSAYMLDGEDLSAKNKFKSLAIIASDIMKNLSTEQYFTFLYDDKTAIEHGLAEKGVFTYDKTKLKLSFYLPLLKPQEINHRTLKLFVFEAAYYIDMSWNNVGDIKLSPELSRHCSLDLILPDPTEKQFNYAMSLPVNADPDHELGLVFSQSVDIICNKYRREG